MSFDPKGTQPGLSNDSPAEPKILHIKCRRPECKSMRATEIGAQNQAEHNGVPHNRIYRCVECGNTWGVNTGGFAAI
jgi:DNA-directed RNA polymerase subunit M/transcription elongation factor TFIIS